MLVLALQFSKGSERGRVLDDFLTGHHCWDGHWQSRIVQGTPWAAGARAPCRSLRFDDPRRVGALKTEEKTKLVEPACQEDESCD